MERYMFNFLLENDPEYLQILDDFSDCYIDVHPLFFGFGQF